MPAIAGTDMRNGGAPVVTKTTLSASDSLTYAAPRNQVLILDNITAGALTVNIDGDGAGVVSVPGVGDVDVSAGFSTAPIAAGACVAIPLRGIEKYLKGVIAVTGGVGIEAQLLEF